MTARGRRVARTFATRSSTSNGFNSTLHLFLTRKPTLRPTSRSARQMALPYRRERIADEITAERPIAFAYRSGNAAVRGSVSRQIVVVHEFDESVFGFVKYGLMPVRQRRQTKKGASLWISLLDL